MLLPLCRCPYLRDVLFSILLVSLVRNVTARPSTVSAALARRQGMYDTGDSMIDEDEQVHRREFFSFISVGGSIAA